MTKKQRAEKIIELLEKEYPLADCTLDYDEAWKLLVSVRLAAQCTDARVNVVVKDLFAKYPSPAALAAATPEEIEEKYGMTRVAIRSHVYRNNIPSKKEHGQIFYSKLHFDLSKKTTEDDSSEYYTVQEAMKKYSLSRDSVYGVLQFHEIKREKKGRFVRFLKVEFDHVMGARK